MHHKDPLSIFSSAREKSSAQKGKQDSARLEEAGLLLSLTINVDHHGFLGWEVSDSSTQETGKID